MIPGLERDSISLLLRNALRDALSQRVLRLFDVMSSASAPSDASENFRKGLEISIRAYECACEILDEYNDTAIKEKE